MATAGDKKTFRVTLEQDLETTVRDGTILRTDLYRPDVDGLFPTLVCRTPYDKNTYREKGHKMAERGYLVAIQDVRGRYASDGEFRPGFYSADQWFSRWLKDEHSEAVEGPPFSFLQWAPTSGARSTNGRCREPSTPHITCTVAARRKASAATAPWPRQRPKKSR